MGTGTQMELNLADHTVELERHSFLTSSCLHSDLCAAVEMSPCQQFTEVCVFVNTWVLEMWDVCWSEQGSMGRENRNMRPGVVDSKFSRNLLATHTHTRKELQGDSLTRACWEIHTANTQYRHPHTQQQHSTLWSVDLLLPSIYIFIAFL